MFCPVFDPQNLPSQFNNDDMIHICVINKVFDCNFVYSIKHSSTTNYFRKGWLKTIQGTSMLIFRFAVRIKLILIFTSFIFLVYVNGYWECINKYFWAQFYLVICPHFFTLRNIQQEILIFFYIKCSSISFSHLQHCSQQEDKNAK